MSDHLRNRLRDELLATIAAVRRTARRTVLPEEVMLIVHTGEDTAWVLTDLGVAQVPAPHDLAGIDAVLARAMDGRL